MVAERSRTRSFAAEVRTERPVGVYLDVLPVAANHEGDTAAFDTCGLFVNADGRSAAFSLEQLAAALARYTEGVVTPKALVEHLLRDAAQGRQWGTRAVCPGCGWSCYPALKRSVACPRCGDALRSEEVGVLDPAPPHLA